MNNDLDVIIKKFPHRMKELHINTIIGHNTASA